MDVNGSLVFDASAASEIKKLRIEKVTANPAIVASDVGRLIYNTTTKQLLIGLNSTGTTYVWDVIATATAGDITALQAEVDAIETAMGLNANGTFNSGAFSGSLAGKSSYVAIINALQTVSDAALPRAGGSLTGALGEAPLGSIVASTLTMDIGSVNANTLTVTGTSAVTSFGTAPEGTTRTLIFNSSFFISSGTAIVLPTGGVITTEVGDVAEFISTGANKWKCTSYIRASGQPLAPISPTTTTQRFNGSTTQIAMSVMNIVEPTKIVASTIPTTYIFYTSQGSVQYNTVNATANWIDNITHSASTTLNTAMAIGDTMTVAHVTTQGATAFFLTALQVDGVATPIKWQGGTAPAAGNVSGNDIYTFTLIKT
uniref:hypothetical protein n=1 Tax=Janthinobacterium sp. TaxID=1871054 RepID=UPI002612815B